MIALGRRRSGGPSSGYRLTVPAADLERYGLGYPITCEFALPVGTGGATAQWRLSTRVPWSNIPSAPAARFDGLDRVARRDGDRMLISIAFPEGIPEMHLRVVNAGGVEVGTWVGVSECYDDRAFALIFTYDDNPSVPTWDGAVAAHQSAKLWMSPGLHPSQWGSGYDTMVLGGMQVEAATAGGYVEPINHSWSHVNMDGYPDDQALADQEVFQGRDALVALARPAQSRGRCHGYIYPNGAYPAVVLDALARSNHLTGRLVGNHDWAVSQGTYATAAVNPTYGIITGQMPSVIPLNGIIRTQVDVPTQQAAADKVSASIDYARSNALRMCHVYAYMLHYSWGSSDPWPQMLATAGAAADIWSVGYGHHALYAHTRDRLTVEDLTA